MLHLQFGALGLGHTHIRAVCLRVSGMNYTSLELRSRSIKPGMNYTSRHAT